jgi:hypothetical protein
MAEVPVILDLTQGRHFSMVSLPSRPDSTASNSGTSWRRSRRSARRSYHTVVRGYVPIGQDVFRSDKDYIPIRLLK